MPPRKNPTNLPKTTKSVLQKVKKEKPAPLKKPKIIKVQIPIPRRPVTRTIFNGAKATDVVPESLPTQELDEKPEVLVGANEEAVPQLVDNISPTPAEVLPPARKKPRRQRPKAASGKKCVKVENVKTKETSLEESILNGRNITPLANIVAETVKAQTLKEKLQIIDKANEVANSQLVKNAVLFIQEETPAPKKRGRLKVVCTQTPEKIQDNKAHTSKSINVNQTRVTKITRAVTRAGPKSLTRTIVNTEAVKKTAAKEVKKATQSIGTQSKITEYLASEESPGRRLRKKSTKGKNEGCTITCTVQNGGTQTTGASPNNKAKRKPSISSNSDKSCLNWAKDISSSATSYVSVNGNVYIDGKMPVLRIKPINFPTKPGSGTDAENHLSDSESSDSSSTSSSSVSVVSENCTSVNLSLSTNTPKSPADANLNAQNKENKSIISQALEKLSNNLKDLDLEFINWISFKEDESINSKKIKKRVLDEWKNKEESEIIIQCQHLKQLCSDNGSSHKEIDRQEKLDTSVVVDEETHFPVPSNKRPEVAEDDNPDLTSPRSDRFKQSRDNYDDDDALSLFAESITGLESVKQNSFTANSVSIDNRNAEKEYIPKPIKSIDVKFDYQPTKIKDLVQNAPVNVEKQNADSTSILKELEKEDVLDYEPLEENPKPPQEVPMPHNGYRPIRLMASHFAPTYGTQSKTFGNVCFYNLIGNCKKAHCHFSHIQVPAEEIRKSLKTLSTENFVGEYLLLRNWPLLRRKYGLIYVEECMSRRLTRYLIEMSIDFCNKAKENSKEDDIQKLIVLESVLMYLNVADLSNCVDILQFIMPDGKQICDIYIETIANGQNFSRYKMVFIKLTHIMVGICRHFNKDDVSHILERVCILPYEEQLAKAMMNIILNTDLAILDNSMTNYFELQLKTFNKELYDKFIISKKQRTELVAEKNSIVVDTRRNFAESSMFVDDHIVNSMANEREKSYTSPDTTAIENMNKSEEPMESRTVEMHKLQFRVNNTSPSSSEEFWPKLPHTKRNWAPVVMRGRGRGWSFSPPVRIRGSPRGTKRRGDMHKLYGVPRASYVRRSGPTF